MAIVSGSLSFRPLTRADLGLLQGWFKLHHVNRWWREAPDLEEVEAKYGPRIDGEEPTHVFIITFDKKPIGWIQVYRWSDYPEHGAQIGATPDSAGIDLAIGEPQYVGVGIGTRAITSFVRQRVFNESGVQSCLCDPEVANEASLRAFEKAGFTQVRTIQLRGEAVLRRIIRMERPVTQYLKMKFSEVSPKQYAQLTEAAVREFGNVPIVQKYEWTEPTHSLLAVEGNMLVASVNVVEREVLWDGIPVRAVGVNNLITHPQHRGRGHATKLMQMAVRFAFIELKARVAILFCADELIPYYESLGWTRTHAKVRFEQPSGPCEWPSNRMWISADQSIPEPNLIDLAGLPW